MLASTLHRLVGVDWIFPILCWSQYSWRMHQNTRASRGTRANTRSSDRLRARVRGRISNEDGMSRPLTDNDTAQAVDVNAVMREMARVATASQHGRWQRQTREGQKERGWKVWLGYSGR